MSEAFIFFVGAICGAIVIAMWLGSRLARVTTDRNRLQAVVDRLRKDNASLGEDLKHADEGYDELYTSLTDKVATLTRDCVALQQEAHKAQDGLDMAKDMLSCEIAAHKTTKRQLAAAKGQITKMKRRMS